MRDADPGSGAVDSGGGGLFSLVLDEPLRAPEFFDALRVSKGPSLGTNFTLACPYTLLAHYGELEWAESCGVARHLVRISVGLEQADDLCRRFDEALAAAGV
jgi:cystathionine gamma-synthase